MLMRWLILLVIGVLLAGTPSAEASHAGENSDVSPAHVGVHWPNANEWAFLGEINDYRVANGRGMLQMSRSLAAAARHHAYYMSRTDDVDHTLGSVSWSTNIFNYGYTAGCHIGENVLAGRQSAGGALSLWITSEPHRLNMLDPDWIRIGVGRVYYGAGRYDFYWVTDFGACSHRTIYEWQASEETH
jgi:uncharacterized protein YkwD